MALKRKHSIGPSPRSQSSLPPTPSPGTHMPTLHSGVLNIIAPLDVHMEADSAPYSRSWNFISAGRVKPSDWGNRTRKRFRDNRPDERAVHENTLNKLFAAQRIRPEVTPIPSDILPASQSLHNTSRTQKSTLHTFWKQLPPRLAVGYTVEDSTTTHKDEMLRRCCEDCDDPLPNDLDGTDVDMADDLAIDAESFACCDCGKVVCAKCAVVSLKRHCLPCATSGSNSRRWW